MAEEKKIGAIKEELQAAEDSMLPDFIARYEKDERSGVKSLVEKQESGYRGLRQSMPGLKI